MESCFHKERVDEDSLVRCSSKSDFEWKSVSHWVIMWSLFDEHIDEVGTEETNLSSMLLFSRESSIVVVSIFTTLFNSNNGLCVSVMLFLNHENTSVIFCWEISSHVAPCTLSPFVLLIPSNSPAETFVNMSGRIGCFVFSDIFSWISCETF